MVGFLLSSFAGLAGIGGRADVERRGVSGVVRPLSVDLFDAADADDDALDDEEVDDVELVDDEDDADVDLRRRTFLGAGASSTGADVDGFSLS